MSTRIDPWLTIAELHALLRAGRTSSLELTQLYLARLEKYGEGLGAVVTITRELALARARLADAEIAAGSWRGMLHGIPFGVKDLLATKGIATSWGAAPYRNRVLDFDATVIERLEAAGAVLCAKLAMVELAGGFGYNQPDASFTGPGRTPWNREFWSGGSSSGPGAAVAAALVPFAIGSETSGSILTPSAFSGVTGFRPTYGVVSRHGAMALSWTLDKLGPMGRNADDCALVMHAIAGRDPKDASSLDVSIDWLDARPAGKRVGVVRGSSEKAQPAVRENFERSIRQLADLGYEISEIDFPDLPYGSISVIIDAEGASALEELLVTGKAKELTAPEDRIGGYESAATLAVDYLRAMRIRPRVQEAIAALFEKVDLVASPTRATVAYPIGRSFSEAYPGVSGGPGVIPAMNLAGAPAIALPNGFGENGLPTSIQLNAAPLRDRDAIVAGRELQAVTGWHRAHPDGYL